MALIIIFRNSNFVQNNEPWPSYRNPDHYDSDLRSELSVYKVGRLNSDTCSQTRLDRYFGKFFKIMFSKFDLQSQLPDFHHAFQKSHSYVPWSTGSVRLKSAASFLQENKIITFQSKLLFHFQQIILSIYSAIAILAVRPGDSIPIRLIKLL